MPFRGWGAFSSCSRCRSSLIVLDLRRGAAVLGRGRLQPPGAAARAKRTRPSPRWKPSSCRQVDLVASTCRCRGRRSQRRSRVDGSSTFWAGLQGAAAQFAASLAAARAAAAGARAHRRPERGAGCAGDGLGARRARRRARPGRARACRTPVLAGEPNWPLQTHRRRRASSTRPWRATTQAIAQFPAVLLAWLFGLQPARGLRARL